MFSIPDILATWKSNGWETPVLEEKFSPDRTILSLSLSQSKSKKVAISDLQKQQIIEFITDNSVCKSKALADSLGVTQARVRILLSQLIADGCIISEGENRNKTYRLKP